MKLRRVIDLIADFSPFSWAEDWDNSGLILGDPEWEISSIVATLDVSLPVLDFADGKDHDLIVSHHPFIFKALRSIDLSQYDSRILSIAMEKKIALVAMHTNWDYSPTGMNVILSDLLGLEGVVPLAPVYTGGWGIGATGKLPFQILFRDLPDLIIEKWSLSWIRGYGSSDRKIQRIALCGGSGGDLWETALASGADVFITADIKYHQILESVSRGLSILVVDHGEMEKLSIPSLSNQLSEVTGLEVVEYADMELDKYKILR